MNTREIREKMKENEEKRKKDRKRLDIKYKKGIKQGIGGQWKRTLD